MPETKGKTDGSLALSEMNEPKIDTGNVGTKKPSRSKARQPKKAENISEIDTAPNNDTPNPIMVQVLNSITEIPLSELHSPEFNPFNIVDGEAMDRLAESIKEYGVHEPGLARPRPDGKGYELLIGNRRKRACELAGLTTMPVIIREMDDDNAVITMVDSNLEQREKLLFSEKAWAYRIKMEALNHKGIKGNKLSVDILTEQSGESKNQIFRLMRLTELVINLLDKVDTKQIAFNPAVELSYLSKTEQLAVVSAMEANDMKPSLSQAVRLKKLKQSGELTEEQIHAILSEEKPPTNSANKEVNRFRKFFPADYTPKQMYKVISDLLAVWQAESTPQNQPIENIEEIKKVEPISLAQ